MLRPPALAALNHLLTQSGWAGPRLARFSGKTAKFDIVPFSLACTIAADGALVSAAEGATPDATCTIAPPLLPRLALRDEAALGQIKTCGDAALVEEIFFLWRNLRWDAAEDISRVTGDVAAERIVRFADAIVQQARGVGQNLSQALAEYWTEERPLLAKPAPVADFARQVERLSDEVARLEQRINRL
jgi:ubiquinone biosynthesis protein UbiJ